MATSRLGCEWVGGYSELFWGVGGWGGVIRFAHPGEVDWNATFNDIRLPGQFGAMHFMMKTTRSIKAVTKEFCQPCYEHY